MTAFSWGASNSSGHIQQGEKICNAHSEAIHGNKTQPGARKEALQLMHCPTYDSCKEAGLDQDVELLECWIGSCSFGLQGGSIKGGHRCGATHAHVETCWFPSDFPCSPKGLKGPRLPSSCGLPSRNLGPCAQIHLDEADAKEQHQSGHPEACAGMSGVLSGQTGRAWMLSAGFGLVNLPILEASPLEFVPIHLQGEACQNLADGAMRQATENTCV